MRRLIGLAFALWARQTAAMLGVSVRAVTWLGAAVASCLVGLAVAGGVVLGSTLGSTAGSTVDAVDTAVRSIGNGLVLTAMVTGAVFGMFSGSSSNLETTLRLAGAGRRERAALLIAPSATLASGLAALLGSMALIPMFAFVPGKSDRVLLAVVLLPAAMLAAAASFAVQTAVARGLTRRLRLPPAHAAATATGAILGAGVYVCLPAIRPDTSQSLLRQVSPGEVAGHLHAALAGERSGIAGAALVLGLVLVALVLGTRLAAADTFTEADRVPRFLAASPSTPRGTVGAHVWFEAVTLARNPTTVVLALVQVVGCVVAVAARSSTAGQLALVVLPASAGAVGLRASGHNLRNAWMLWVVAGRGPQWIVGKILGVAFVGAALFAPGFVVSALAAGPRTVVFAAFQVFLPTLAGSLFAGTLLPITDEQPLGTAMTAVLATGVTAAATVGIERALGVAGLPSSLLTPPVFVAAACLGTWLQLDRIDAATVTLQG